MTTTTRVTVVREVTTPVAPLSCPPPGEGVVPVAPEGPVLTESVVLGPGEPVALSPGVTAVLGDCALSTND